MARRRDGRELFEVFRETVSPPGGHEEHQPAQHVSESPRTRQVSDAMHVFRLGDRPHIELYLSNAWATGLAIFLVLVLIGAFAMGRKYAPEPKPAEKVEAPNEFLTNEASRVADVVRSNAPQALAPANVTVPQSTAPPPTRQAETVRPSQPAASTPVTGQGLYTLCVITYTSPNSPQSRAQADSVVKFLKDQGFSEARSLVSKSGRHRIVAVGNYATKSDPRLADDKVRISALSFSGKAIFKDAYPTDLNFYQ